MSRFLSAIFSKRDLSFIIPYFIASAIPSARISGVSVLSVSLSQITSAGCLNAPTRFFPAGISIAVLPPTDESICARSVVGICTKSTPLRYVAAAKPAISPVTPPPKAMIISFLVISFCERKSYILFKVSEFFEVSPFGNTKRLNEKPFSASDFSTASQYKASTTSSVIITVFLDFVMPPISFPHSLRIPRSITTSYGLLTLTLIVFIVFLL